MKQHLSIREVMEMCVGHIKVAGFELRNASMRSEACYYGLPGRLELLRVAAHKRDKAFTGLTKVVAKLTITGRTCDPTDMIWMDPDKIHDLTARAIGKYMIASGQSKKQE